jgi:hypothetical protein
MLYPLLVLQGRHGVADVVHAVKKSGLPIRVDRHVRLSKNIGYLAVKFVSGSGRDRKNFSGPFRATHTFVMDSLIQNFFPGPTWLAASNARGANEPMPEWITYRQDAMMGGFEVVFLCIQLLFLTAIGFLLQ